MIKLKHCSVCGSAFECGANDAAGKCWCCELENVVSGDSASDCLCPQCLKAKIETIKATGPNTVTK